MNNHDLTNAICMDRVNEIRDLLNSGRVYSQLQLDNALRDAIWYSTAEDAAAVELLLAHGAGLGSISYVGVDVSRLAVFQRLFDSGWDINSFDIHGDTGLICVVRSEPCVKWFLDHGADPNQRNRNGVTAIATAVFCDPAQPEVACNTIKLLVSRGAELDPRALYNAVTHHRGGTLVMKCLLDLGLNVNAPTGYHDSTLFAAINDGNLEIVRLLLDYGANYNLECHGRTSLQYATALGNRLEICKLLMQADGGFFAE